MIVIAILIPNVAAKVPTNEPKPSEKSVEPLARSLEKANSTFKGLAVEAKKHIKKEIKVNKPTTNVEQWRAEVSKYEWNVEEALKVMSCESGGNQTAQNRTSTAGGLFQILNGTWSGNTSYPLTDKYDGVKNIEVAHHIWEHRGWTPWKASYSCHGIR